jgi:hypothetical protein
MYGLPYTINKLKEKLSYLFVFHAHINEMHGSRSKIPSKNLVRQCCVEGFNSGVKVLKKGDSHLKHKSLIKSIPRLSFLALTQGHFFFTYYKPPLGVSALQSLVLYSETPPHRHLSSRFAQAILSQNVF